MAGPFFVLRETMSERDKRFACPCCGVNWIDPRLEHLVKEVEGWAGALTVTSGFRCEKHNKAVGGSRTSSHRKGLAVDVACFASRRRFMVLFAAIKLGIVRVGIHRRYLHLDMDRHKDQRVAWFY